MRRHSTQWLVLFAFVGVLVVSVSPLRADPATDGAWTSAFTWGQAGGIEAVHTFMLPTGKVLFWSTYQASVGLWDPVTDTLPRPETLPRRIRFAPDTLGCRMADCWSSAGIFRTTTARIGRISTIRSRTRGPTPTRIRWMFPTWVRRARTLQRAENVGIPAQRRSAMEMCWLHLAT